jgi:hypothetical protein
MSDKEEKALKEWQQQLKKETQKLKGKQLSDQVATVRRKLEILKAVERRLSWAKMNLRAQVLLNEEKITGVFNKFYVYINRARR